MSATEQGHQRSPTTAGREIVISRIIGAPRDWCSNDSPMQRLSRWWGPKGFTTTTRAFEFRVGGEWDFVMHETDNRLRSGSPGRRSSRPS